MACTVLAVPLGDLVQLLTRKHRSAGRAGDGNGAGGIRYLGSAQGLLACCCLVHCICQAKISGGEMTCTGVLLLRRYGN
jgi:hypothetical protein